MSASRLASRCRLCPSIAGALACVFSTAGKEGDDDDDAEDEGVVVVVCDSDAHQTQYQTQTEQMLVYFHYIISGLRPCKMMV